MINKFISAASNHHKDFTLKQKEEQSSWSGIRCRRRRSSGVRLQFTADFHTKAAEIRITKVCLDKLPLD
ncbi:hypothetical protein VZT92_025361 [Zoarces viviparus]|uniref:Uncharacterized protein n=1 Tax=Zoarces viviparus TaxID=48416 RepID=A0AAW1DZ08_ZOAVI